MGRRELHLCECVCVFEQFVAGGRFLLLFVCNAFGGFVYIVSKTNVMLWKLHFYLVIWRVRAVFIK